MPASFSSSEVRSHGMTQVYTAKLDTSPLSYSTGKNTVASPPQSLQETFANLYFLVKCAWVFLGEC